MLLGNHKKLSIDCVSVTVRESLEIVLARLNLTLDTIERPARPLPGRGYTHAFELLNPNTLERRALVMYDAHRQPHVYAEGVESYDSPAVFAAVCKCFPQKWVPSRIDIALDFYGPSRFDEFAASLTSMALRRNLMLSHLGDWVRGKDRTLYLGSRNSTHYVRLYEFRACHGYGPEVRLELELKPSRRNGQREKVASLDPWFMLTTSPALREFLASIGTNLKAVQLSAGPKPIQSIERDLSYVASQAFLPLLRLYNHFGYDLQRVMDELVSYRMESERVRQQSLAKPVTDCHNQPILIHSAPPTEV